MPADELYRSLGRMEGKIDQLIEAQASINNQNTKRLDGIEERLRGVERGAVISGAVSGGIISIGMAIIIAKGKAVLGLG